MTSPALAPGEAAARWPLPTLRRGRWLLVALWFCAASLDTVTTYVLLSTPGFGEANPVPAMLMEQVGVAPVLWAGGALSAALCWFGLLPVRSSLLLLLQRGLVLLALLKLCVALHNLSYLV